MGAGEADETSEDAAVVDVAEGAKDVGSDVLVETNAGTFVAVGKVVAVLVAAMI